MKTKILVIEDDSAISELICMNLEVSLSLLDVIPVTYSEEMGSTVNTHAPSWPYEGIDIIYDEQGFTSFTWTDPCEVELLSNEYEFLLPFSDIQNIFEEMFLKKYEGFIELEESRTDSFAVNEIRLGYMRIIEKEGDTTGTIVPVWDFMGTHTISLDGGKEIYLNGGSFSALLTINALDGTLIDRCVGY